MPRGTSITRRVRAAILTTSVVVLCATAAAFTIYEHVSFRAHMARSTAILAAVTADQCAAALQFGNRDDASSILYSLDASEEVVVAALYNENQRLFASYPRQPDARLLPGRVQGRKPGFEAGSFVTFAPVILDGKKIGTLFVRSSLHEVNQRLRNYGGIVAIVLACSIAGAYLLARVLQQRISSPILALASTTRTIAERGDYSVRAQTKSDDEVGVLTTSFNHMLEQIQQRERALRESEQALREQLNLVNTITDNTPSCLWMLDAEGRCTFANPASERISGFKPVELLGKQLHLLVHHVRPDGSAFPIEQCPLCGLRPIEEPVEGFEDRFVHKDGHFYPVRCNARPIAHEGRPVGTVIEVQDITDIVKAREAVAQYQQRLEHTVEERTAALRETVQQLETFSYSIVHDMRAPLRTMRSFAGILKEEEGERLTPAGVDYLDRIMAGAVRLDALINDVLTYSRVTKGEASLGVLSLDRLVSDIIREYPDLHQYSANIQVRRPLGNVIGNPALLTQCISNLLGNAVKFVPKDRAPRVIVWAEKIGKDMRLWVEDNGIGIAQEHRKNVYGLFHRLTVGAEYPGTGVGLAIVKRAVERMNGSIDFESEVGRGTKFWIELPAA
jgi:PAS domain S-box-containing protein